MTVTVVDTFNRTVAAGGWGSSDNSQAWTAQTSCFGATVYGGNAAVDPTLKATITSTTAQPGTYLTQATSMGNFDLYLTFNMSSPSTTNFYLCYADNASGTAGYYIYCLSNSIKLYNGNTYVLMGSSGSGSTIVANTDYILHVNRVTNYMQAKYWKSTLTEPNAWNLASSDSTYTTGLLGIYASCGNGNTITFKNCTIGVTSVYNQRTTRMKFYNSAKQIPRARATFMSVAGAQVLISLARNTSLTRASLIDLARSTSSVRTTANTVSRDRFLLSQRLVVGNRGTYRTRAVMRVSGRDAFSIIYHLRTAMRDRYSIQAPINTKARDTFATRTTATTRTRGAYAIRIATSTGARSRFLIILGMHTLSRARYATRAGLGYTARARYSTRIIQTAMTRARFLLSQKQATRARARAVVRGGLVTRGSGRILVSGMLIGSSRSQSSIRAQLRGLSRDRYLISRRLIEQARTRYITRNSLHTPANAKFVIHTIGRFYILVFCTIKKVQPSGYNGPVTPNTTVISQCILVDQTGAPITSVSAATTTVYFPDNTIEVYSLLNGDITIKSGGVYQMSYNTGIAGNYHEVWNITSVTGDQATFSSDYVAHL